MRALLAGLLATVALAVLVGCGSGDGDRALSGFGRTIELPAGWTGRIYRIPEGGAVVLHATTASLPSRDNARGHEAKARMGPADVFVEVLDIGTPPRGLDTDPAWTASASLEIRRGDIRETFEGQARNLAAQAMRSVIVGDRALLLYVTFGSRPDRSALGEVNRVLATFRLLSGSRRAGSATSPQSSPRRPPRRRRSE